ncbi:ABC transporter permease [Herbiconiux sp. P16]|uniref:ABC transporter permease n=1 Tax=Herbiconiux wuyangfengii TaxID=3342794 RepID=UPI0035BAFD14
MNAPSSALWQLSLASAKELLRSGKSFFGLAIVFVFFLALVVTLNVVESDGSDQPDVLRANLSLVLVCGLMAIAFAGTTVPLVALRQRGTLKLLGTTPLRRFTFLLAQTPVRFLLGTSEAAVILAIAGGHGYLQPLSALRLCATFLIGFAMFFAFAYLLASRSSNPDLMLQLMGLVPVVVLFASGTFLPFADSPPFLEWMSRTLPSTWFLQALNADLIGEEPFLDITVLWGLMAMATGLLLALGTVLFRWDQGDL